MPKKTVKFTRSGIAKLPNDKPVVYKVKRPSGITNYAGVAKRGRIQKRLMEHLPCGSDPLPGTKVQIEQMSSIAEAKAKEEGIISRSKPKYNKRGK